ncbi:MAG: dockerin type I domain-containing protein, partial [Minisyncoccia bacterium]
MKKFLAVSFLTLSLIISSAPVANAATIAELQAQLNALMAQLTALQEQLNSNAGPTVIPPRDPNAFCYTFTRNLKFGDGKTSFDEPMVDALQMALQKEGFTISDKEIKGGSIFGESTASAVVGFQQKYASEILTPNGLLNGNGFVGNATRAKLNALYGCGKTTTTIIPTNKSTVSLFADKTTINVGQMVSLRFNADNVSYCAGPDTMISRNIQNSINGMTTLYPKETTTYSIHCYRKTPTNESENGYPDASASVIVYVNQTTYKIGDVNGDGSVTCADSKMVADYSVGLTKLTAEEKSRADVNGDGAVNIIDAQQIVRNFGLNCSTTTSTPVNLKLVSNVTGNTGTLISASIAGYATNSDVSYWKLNIACEDGAVISNYSGSNVCGTENTYYRYNMSNSGNDYIMITSFGLKNTSSLQRNIVFSLVAYDGNNNNIGGDKEGIVLGNATVPTTIVGDVNGDGTVNCTDSKMLADYSVGLITLTSEQKSRADVNGDGAVNIIDAQQIVRNFGLNCSTTQSTPQAPIISYLSSQTVKTGDMVTVYGSNFNQYTFAYLDGDYGPAVTSSYLSPTTLSFIVPSTTSSGTHKVYVAEKASNFGQSGFAYLYVNTISQTTGTPSPTVSFTYNNSTSPVSVTSGGSVNFSWSATNINKCQMFKNGSLYNDGVYNTYGGNTASYSGTFNVGNITSSDTYTLTCTGTGGSQSASMQVNVSGQATTPTSTTTT